MHNVVLARRDKKTDSCVNYGVPLFNFRKRQHHCKQCVPTGGIRDKGWRGTIFESILRVELYLSEPRER